MRSTGYSPHVIMFGRKSSLFLMDTNDDFRSIYFLFFKQSIILTYIKILSWRMICLKLITRTLWTKCILYGKKQQCTELNIGQIWKSNITILTMSISTHLFYVHFFQF